MQMPTYCVKKLVLLMRAYSDEYWKTGPPTQGAAGEIRNEPSLQMDASATGTDHTLDE